jgi:hypothetical protein
MLFFDDRWKHFIKLFLLKIIFNTQLMLLLCPELYNLSLVIMNGTYGTYEGQY